MSHADEKPTEEVAKEADAQTTNVLGNIRQWVARNGFWLNLGGKNVECWAALLTEKDLPLETKSLWIRMVMDDNATKNKIEYAKMDFVGGFIRVGTTCEFRTKKAMDIIHSIGIVSASQKIYEIKEIVVTSTDQHLVPFNLSMPELFVRCDGTTLVIKSKATRGNGISILDLARRYRSILEEFTDEETIGPSIFRKEPGVNQPSWTGNDALLLSTVPKEIVDELKTIQPRKTAEGKTTKNVVPDVKTLVTRRNEGPVCADRALLRPNTFEDVIGQEVAIAQIRANLASPWRQHMIFMGPPGVGKTTVARLCLEEVRGKTFPEDAPFVEYDCTMGSHDERNRVSNLLGFVVDGSYRGSSGRSAPDIRVGVVNQAHRGILFLDEIGELPEWVATGLLKVMEDGASRLDGAFMNDSWKELSEHEQDAFLNGLPANILIIGATTRSLKELNPALVSRSIIVRFRPLNFEQKIIGLRKTTKRAGILIDDEAIQLAASESENMRDATLNVLRAHGFALLNREATVDVLNNFGFGLAEQKEKITADDVRRALIATKNEETRFEK